MKAEHKPAQSRLRTYGLTPEEYAVLAAATHCQLCLRPFGPRRPRVVEHDHRTGLIRSCSVCKACNYRLGMLHDDAGWLRRAAEYLSDPPAPYLIGEHYVPGSPPTLGSGEAPA